MKRFTIIDAADQQFGTILENQRVTLRLRYNVTTDRWAFDLAIDDTPVIYGRRIVTGVDLLSPFNLGIGSIFAMSTNASDQGAPSRDSLIDGTVRLYYVAEAEIEEIAGATVSP